MSFFGAIGRAARGVYNQVNPFDQGKTFSDAYNTPEEERRRRQRVAAQQAQNQGQAQPQGGTQYVNNLVSGNVKSEEERRREVVRNAARQQVQNPIGGFLAGVLNKGKNVAEDYIDINKKALDFVTDPKKVINTGETVRKAIVNATPPAQLYNRIRTDQRVRQNRQEVDQAEQRINNQLKEQTGGQIGDLPSAIKMLSARRSELSPEGKKSLLSLLDINRQLAGARQQTEEVNLQNVDPVGILEDALFTGGQPVADMVREFTTRGGARIVKELESNKLGKAMVPFIGETSKGIDVAQESNLGKFIFGRGKVDKASDDIKSFTKDIPILRDIFKYAPLATAGGIAINLPGIGGTKAGKFGKAAEELSKVDNADDVIKVIGKYDDLTKAFGDIDDTLKPALLERLTKETRPKEIQKVIQKTSEASKGVQFTDDILRTAKGSESVSEFAKNLTDETAQAILKASKNRAKTPEANIIADLLKTGEITPKSEELFSNLKAVVENQDITNKVPGTLKDLDPTVVRPTADFGGVDETIEGLKNLDADQAKLIDDLAKQAGFAGLDDVARTLQPSGVSNIDEASPKNLTEAVYGAQDEAIDADKFTNQYREARQEFSPDRLIRENITQPVREAVNTGLFKLQTSSNPIARGVGRLTQGVNRELGTPQEVIDARRKMRGTTEFGRLSGADLTKRGESFSKESLDKIWASLDPEQALKTGKGNPLAKLSKEEEAFRGELQTVIDSITEYKISKGLIDPNKVSSATDLRRGYSIFEEIDAKEANKVYGQARRDLLRSLKGRVDDIPEEVLSSAITDPAYLVGKRASEAQQAGAMVDYANFLKAKGYTSDVPKPGYRQLPDNKLFGEAAGKYVPQNFAEDFTGFEYNMGFLNSFNDIVTAYDRWAPRQAKKQLLTIFNPAVRLGNQLSNRVVFANLAGHNPIDFNITMQKVKTLQKNRDPLYLEAVQQGLTASDVTRAEFVQRVAQYADDPNVARQAIEYAKKSYSNADDRARIASYVLNRKAGMSPDDAARATQRGFQDYATVGFFYDLAAKTPLIGNAFVRFAGDASRIMSNAALDHPLRTIGTVALWQAFTNQMSKMSGESTQDKNTREDRFGAPKIPFTDISLTTQTPWGEVNLARFMPFYQLNDVGGDFTRFLPVQGNPLKPQGWQDPLLGQVGQILTDTDFRGKSIRDPENVIFDKGVYERSGGQAGAKYTPNDKEDRKNNIFRFLFNQNAPLGREIDSLVSSQSKKFFGFLGSDKGKDIYGKERSGWQAIGRSLGVKVEEFGPKQAEKQRETNAFFDGYIKRSQDYVKNNPADADDYYAFNNPTMDRKTNRKVSKLVTPERWNIVLQNIERGGKLFDFLKSESQIASKEIKVPYKLRTPDPIYNNKYKDIVKTVLELRSRPEGDQLETEERLKATNPLVDKYFKDYYKYLDGFVASESTKKNSERVESYFDIKSAEQPKLIKQYFKLKDKSEDEAKAFQKANSDALSAQFDQYADARLKVINAKRKIEGYPPITKEEFNNVTFGYESDEDKVATKLYFKNKGKGYSYGSSSGKGGKGGKSGKTAKDKRVPLSSLTSYIKGLGTDIPDVASQIRAPEVRLNLPRPVASRAKRVKINFRG